MDWANVFMRVSERAVRRRSWMAHYLRARDVLDVNGVQVEADHPWLIEMPRRGTGASQFLYNNAARPVFARTSAGKVFSRFQLWAWNSMKFRNEIYARARMGGYSPGSAEFDRFQRMVLADLFVMGLAGLFPTSLFGSSMPPPYRYMQDLFAYFFGDEREKDRAFYSTLPYHLKITMLGMAPAARLLDPVFIAMTGGDWDKFASNTLWTYFPFGRLAKGISRSVENPSMAAENLFGISLHALRTPSF